MPDTHLLEQPDRRRFPRDLDDPAYQAVQAAYARVKRAYRELDDARAHLQDLLTALSAERHD